jgi:hypothetical protein
MHDHFKNWNGYSKEKKDVYTKHLSGELQKRHEAGEHQKPTSTATVIHNPRHSDVVTKREIFTKKGR